jgi:hypothetical protein
MSTRLSVLSPVPSVSVAAPRPAPTPVLPRIVLPPSCSNARDLARRYAGWEVSVWFPALGGSMRGTIIGFRNVPPFDIVLIAHRMGYMHHDPDNVLLLPANCWYPARLRHLRSLPMTGRTLPALPPAVPPAKALLAAPAANPSKPAASMLGRKRSATARPAELAPDLGRYPHRCTRCGQPALLLFSSVECSSRGCRDYRP